MTIIAQPLARKLRIEPGTIPRYKPIIPPRSTYASFKRAVNGISLKMQKQLLDICSEGLNYF